MFLNFFLEFSSEHWEWTAPSSSSDVWESGLLRQLTHQVLFSWFSLFVYYPSYLSLSPPPSLSLSLSLSFSWSLSVNVLACLSLSLFSLFMCLVTLFTLFVYPPGNFSWFSLFLNYLSSVFLYSLCLCISFPLSFSILSVYVSILFLSLPTK